MLAIFKIMSINAWFEDCELSAQPGLSLFFSIITLFAQLWVFVQLARHADFVHVFLYLYILKINIPYSSKEKKK